jgi:hypothetical protein
MKKIIEPNIGLFRETQPKSKQKIFSLLLKYLKELLRNSFKTVQNPDENLNSSYGF